MEIFKHGNPWIELLEVINCQRHSHASALLSPQALPPPPPRISIGVTPQPSLPLQNYTANINRNRTIIVEIGCSSVVLLICRIFGTRLLSILALNFDITHLLALTYPEQLGIPPVVVLTR